ncbi:retinoid-inducible serine carboxypeptidase-like [Tachypleus tridentatus]|uniref:retinoid-inducible serine carboxypeptidase-like n=1 Tax=Tachypleus tridentatus TaxID=6853 RepID=UPI003FD0E73F
MLSKVLFCIGVVVIFSSGIQSYTGKNAWGYVNVRTDAYMFWWLYYAESPKENYNKSPLVLWLQGGPGASSCGYGNFMELGPLDVNLKPRNTTWVKNTNVLFIDNPVGTGFSYVKNLSALTKNNSQIADDLVTLMKHFFQKIPEFQKSPLYIFSESYGGKMAASFALALYKAVKSGKISCNFQGVTFGDSWISPIDSVATWGPYLYTVSMVDKQGLEVINASVQDIRQSLAKGQYVNATELWARTEDIVEKYTNGIDWYNILSNVGEQSKPVVGSLPPNHILHKSYMRHVGNFNGDPLFELMNGKIKETLRVIPKNVTWGGQSGDVFDALKGDFMKPVTAIVDILLNTTDLKVVVYNGQLDLIVDAPGTSQWIDSLKWPGISGFKKAERTPIILKDQYTGGFVKSFKNFHFFQILKAGHMVPADAGEAALKMLTMITRNK